MPQFSFTEWEIDSEASMAWPFAALTDRCGIYWLQFSNGESYVGQSVGVVSRLSAHRRRWKDICRLRFLECDPAELNRFEREVIRLAEAHGSVRNKSLTRQPGGLEDVTVEIVPGQSVLLPWARVDRRSASAGDYAMNPVLPSPSQETKFQKLRTNPDYSQVLDVLRRLILGAIPDPVRSQRTLWTLSAMPNTSNAPGRIRLATVNCGVIELAWITESTSEQGKFIRVALNVDAGLSRDLLVKGLDEAGVGIQGGNYQLQRGPYKSDTEVIGLDFFDISDASKALTSPVVLDAIYTLAVRSMRRGMNPQRRHHNAHFADEVFSVLATPEPATPMA